MCYQFIDGEIKRVKPDERHVVRVIELAKQIELDRGRVPIGGWRKVPSDQRRPWDNGVYTNGNCGSLHKHLKSVFSCATAIQEGSHIKSKVGGTIYDIRGKDKNQSYSRTATDELVESFSYNFGSRNWSEYAENPRPNAEQIKQKLIQLEEEEKQYMADTAAAIQDYIKTEEFISLDR